MCGLNIKWGEYKNNPIVDEKNNLKVVKTIENIDDFINVISVFKDEPYYEILDKNACEEEYNLYKKNGLALGCYINNKIAGLNCIVYDSDKKHSVKFDDNDKVAYYSGLAVKNDYRHHGIGKLLVYETDKYLESLKLFDYSYARILLKGSMSEGIFKKYGFSDIYVNNKLIVDDVTYERNNPDVSKSDKRKYMVKILSNNASAIKRR